MTREWYSSGLAADWADAQIICILINNPEENTIMWRNIVIGAAGAVMAVIVLTVAETLWGWMSVVLVPPVPSGAVVAFDGKCPEDGWETYQLGAGRFLLGADKKRALHDTDGYETHTLTVAEMPTHNHNGDGSLLLVKVTGGHTAPGFDTADGHIEFSLRQGYKMESAGKGEAHNNMPPYLVVNFCKRK